MHISSYNCHIRNTDISLLKIVNGIIKIPTNKLINKEISMPLNYLKP